MTKDKGTGAELVPHKDQLPASGTFDYGDMAGAGWENQTSADLAIPFLGILQSNSPQVENNSPDGSKPGLLFNSVTGELADGEKGIIFQPCFTQHAFVEWVPRNDGGGFVAMHDPSSKAVKDALAANGGKTKDLKLGKNQLIETRYVYGQTLDDAGKEVTGFAVISFTSTKLTPERNWRTAMNLLKGKPPIFANRAKIKTVKEKNEKGTFFNFQIEPLAKTWKESLINPTSERDLLVSGQEFAKMINDGKARAAVETQNAGTTATDEAPPF